MRNLPKLRKLTTEGENSWSFEYPRYITLEDMPSLTTVALPHAFEWRYQLSYKNIGELMNHPNIPKRNPDANIHSVDELMSMKETVEALIVDSNACTDKGYTALVLSSFTNLKVFEVGDYSFSFVETVELIGLNQLERVVIGKKCFTKWGEDEMNLKRRFCLKNCKRVKELKMGCCSFFVYSLCGIESDESLEVIEIGELGEWSNTFKYASLELKNLPHLKSLLFGDGTFNYCSHVVFESE
ncbi:hypothetical protein WA577_003527, partial [Blastocystis sp. JDR]